MVTNYRRAQAEAQFQERVRQASKEEKTKAEHDARTGEVDAKTARLKALRLEKERAAAGVEFTNGDEPGVKLKRNE